MTKKRLLLILLLLPLVGVGLFFATAPYPRQLLFGPKIQGVPLCAWQDCFRRQVKQGFERGGMIDEIIRWFGRGEPSLNWESLSKEGKETVLLSLADDRDPSVREKVAHELAMVNSNQAIVAVLVFFDELHRPFGKFLGVLRLIRFLANDFLAFHKRQGRKRSDDGVLLHPSFTDQYHEYITNQSPKIRKPSGS